MNCYFCSNQLDRYYTVRVYCRDSPRDLLKDFHEHICPDCLDSELKKFLPRPKYESDACLVCGMYPTTRIAGYVESNSNFSSPILYDKEICLACGPLIHEFKK